MDLEYWGKVLVISKNKLNITAGRRVLENSDGSHKLLTYLLQATLA